MNDLYDVLIYGCGGHARSVIDVLLNEKPGLTICIVDDHARDNEFIAGLPVLQEDKPGLRFFVAIGDNYERAKVLATKPGQAPMSIVSSKSHIGNGAIISHGVFIGNFVHIGPEAVIGMNSIVNTGAIVEHEVEIGSYCHVGPNATISGRCKIGDFVFVGVGASIIDKVSVCSDVLIGAGSVVVRDIIAPGSYVGCPARLLE